jgi:hypothetical protein
MSTRFLTEHSLFHQNIVVQQVCGVAPIAVLIGAVACVLLIACSNGRQTQGGIWTNRRLCGQNRIFGRLRPWEFSRQTEFSRQNLVVRRDWYFEQTDEKYPNVKIPMQRKAAILLFSFIESLPRKNR